MASPRNGETVGGRARVVGSAPPAARVFANGKRLQLDEQSRFDDQVSPAGGYVIFRVLNGGAETYTVRRVR